MPRRRSQLRRLQEARAELAAAAVLLDLSRSLGEVTTSTDAAQRIAAAVPAVTTADRASVLLPTGDGRFQPAGVVGYGDAACSEHRSFTPADLGVDPDDLPEAVLFRAGHGPRPVEDALAQVGAAAVLLVAVRARGELLALVSADWLDASRVPAEEVVGPRIAALADQASSSLANAGLLDRVRHQALHDALTGLPNQTLFGDRATHALARARRHGERFAVGVLDLDRFKTVNDSLGHRAGDDLLVQVATRLRTAVREPDTVARMGGDEFTLLLLDLEPYGEAVVAERLLAAFEDPFLIEGHQLRVTPSIGLAAFPADGDTPERLLRSADAAMYRAKETGRNTWATYASGMSERAYDRLTLEADLHRALDRHELRLGFQPVVRMTDRATAGVEAIVRWEHPSFGVLGSPEFMPLAEETGLVAEIDAWVLRQACLELGRADAGGAELGWVAVDLSGRFLTRPTLLRHVRTALHDGGLAPERLVVEVAESITGSPSAGLLDALRELRSMGVCVALDHFGRGHAPLAELGNLPLGRIKIDRSFLTGMNAATEDAPVVSGVVAMAHGLGLEVVAMGVETEEQLAFVARFGVDLAQGAVLGRVRNVLDPQGTGTSGA